MRRKIELEYIFSSSVKVLFSRLSTPAGLSEWFADDVFQKGNQFIFIWNGSEQPATLVELKSNAVVRFRWDDAEEEDEYFEFNIKVCCMKARPYMRVRTLLQDYILLK